MNVIVSMPLSKIVLTYVRRAIPRSKGLVRVKRVLGARSKKQETALDFGIYGLHIHPVASIDRWLP